MALDLVNGYSRKDSSSASNVFYAYTTVDNPSDGDFVYSLRRVKTQAGVETVTWANTSQYNFSNWTDRVASFVAPTGKLFFTYSKTSSLTGINSEIWTGFANLSWTRLAGVNLYNIETRDESGVLLDKNGVQIKGPYSSQALYTDTVVNGSNYIQNFLRGGTYSVTLTGQNMAGITSSSYTIHMPETPGLFAFSTTANTAAVVDTDNDTAYQWYDTGNTTILDGTYSSVDISANSSSDYLLFSDFGFSIPLNATITGIQISVVGSYTQSGTRVIESGKIGLMSDVSTNTALGILKSSVYVSDNVDTTIFYGDSTTTWGTTTSSLTPAVVNDTNFGLRYRVKADSGTGTVTSRIDYLTMKVFYTVFFE